eukprot:scaffold6562_cov163-Amphora_coffeaeformis.AAC.19
MRSISRRTLRIRVHHACGAEDGQMGVVPKKWLGFCYEAEDRRTGWNSAILDFIATARAHITSHLSLITYFSLLVRRLVTSALAQTMRNRCFSEGKIRHSHALLLSLIIFGPLSALNTLIYFTPRAPPENLEEIFEKPLDHVKTLEDPTLRRPTTTLLSDSMPGKPYIILHLGPAKTGTSTFQNEMSVWKDRVFELDNVLYGGAYYVPGKHMGRLDVQANFMNADFKCKDATGKARVQWDKLSRNGTLKEYLQNTVPCFDEILSGLQPYHSNGTSLIFSNELLSVESNWKRVPGYNHKVPFDWISLAEALGDEWNFILLIGHRPYLDWIPSAKAQKDKYTQFKRWMNAWPGQGGRVFRPLFPEERLVSPNETLTQPDRRVSRDDLARYLSSKVDLFMHSTQIYEFSSPYIPIRILHLYDPIPVRTNFLCNILPNTPRSCQASIEADMRGKSEFAHMNVGKAKADRIWYDQILTRAVGEGMWKTSGSPTRARMVNKIKHLHEVLLNRTLFDFPHKCPDHEALKYLWDFSWEREQMMLGGRANLTLHQELFQRNIESAKYCNIDSLKTLEQEDWKQFFEGGWRKILPAWT